MLETNSMFLLSQRLEYGMRLRAERTGEPVNAADCARAAGVSAAAVSLWRKNENAMSALYARPLADFFGVDSVWLETGEGYPERQKNAHAAMQNEQVTADQLTALIRYFYAASPNGRSQLLDFAAHAIETQINDADPAAIDRARPAAAAPIPQGANPRKP